MKRGLSIRGFIEKDKGKGGMKDKTVRWTKYFYFFFIKIYAKSLCFFLNITIATEILQFV